MADRPAATATGSTLPRKGHTIRAPVKRPLPCLVILVHGVNDAGEAYAAQEQGLCWGLAERLGRGDLRPHAYRLPSERRDDPLVAEPDRTYYQRTRAVAGHSPVVPFYWGFREEDGRIRKDAWHGEWLDRFGNRIDRNGAKNGGAFANAVNCLPHMWADGFDPSYLIRAGNRLQGSPTHDLRAAPYRSYQVLAALRLAMLIRIIRRRHPRAAINVVAHSMGCCVTLLAQVFLMEEGRPPADTLVLNNTTYSFEENVLDDQQFGGLNQTTAARIETLLKIVRAFHDRAATSPSLEALQAGSRSTGFAGPTWGPGRAWKAGQDQAPREFLERDNRGRIYLYFSPEDQTVALYNTQGIGWQGVPDRYAYQGSDPYDYRTWDRLMDDLEASGFRQRIFLAQRRGGRPFQVGLPCQHVSIRERGDRNESLWTRMERLSRARKTPSRGTLRRINGEALSPAVDFCPGPDLLPISPIDAAIALAHGGDMDRWRACDDPRPYDEWALPLAPAGDHPRLRALLNRGQPVEDQMVRILEVLAEAPGRLRVRYQPTPEGIRKHWQTEMNEANSYHSAIVSHHWHSQAVTAYDLALGEPIAWSEEEQRFQDYLCEVADWRIKADGPPRPGDKLILLNQTGFYDQEESQNKGLIEATSFYYIKGKLPKEVQSAKDAQSLSCIEFETIAIRRGRHVFPGE